MKTIKVKSVFCDRELLRVLRKAKKNDTILFYEMPVKNMEEFRYYQAFLSRLFMLGRFEFEGFNVSGCLAFKKERKN